MKYHFLVFHLACFVVFVSQFPSSTGEIRSNASRNATRINDSSPPPTKKLSLREQYRLICETRNPRPPTPRPTLDAGKKLKVGIVGAGMAGLYSALLLKREGMDVHLFEANADRVGGRVFTYRFGQEKNQYFEAGAMRLPCADDHRPVFQLIDYINEKVAEKDRVKVMDYVLNTDNNYVFVNSVRGPNGNILTRREARENPAQLKFPLEPEDKDKTADQLLWAAIGEYVKRVQDKGVESIMEYDSYSMRTFLTLRKGWSHAKIDYVETMTSQTQQFDHGFVEMIMEYINFSQTQWKTIENGMSRLAEACKKLIGEERFSMGAKVIKISETADERVVVHYLQPGNATAIEGQAEFDQVILAVPPGVIRFLEKQSWPVEKEAAIRNVHFEPLYKIGLRFKSRFWEHVKKPSFGGQATTDLPTRWIVYPSYGLGDDGQGVLLCYSWMSDALKWLPKTPREQEILALRDLSKIYGDQLVRDQFLESKAVSWATEWSLGDAHFFPGQFTNLFNILRESEKNVHFAGEHLSVHHTWILGATDSALDVSRRILGKPDLPALTAANKVPPYCKK